MASTATSTPLSISSSSSTCLIDAKSRRRHHHQPAAAASSLQCLTIPTISHPASPAAAYSTSTRLYSKTTAYCRQITRNVVSLATTGEAPPAEVISNTTTITTTETPEIVKTIQEAWDKVEDKYAVTSLAVAGGVALWGSAGMISAIDRLPLIPGVLELVGIGYTGWFAYQNLVFKPNRETLIQKIKDTYKDITGTS